MPSKAFLQERATELTTLMMALSEMAKAVQHGESLPALTPDQVKGMLLTVGETLLANHRELRKADEPQLRAA
jgi:hypothetical protein